MYVFLKKIDSVLKALEAFLHPKYFHGRVFSVRVLPCTYGNGIWGWGEVKAFPCSPSTPSRPVPFCSWALYAHPWKTLWLAWWCIHVPFGKPRGVAWRGHCLRSLTFPTAWKPLFSEAGFFVFRSQETWASEGWSFHLGETTCPRDIWHFFLCKGRLCSPMPCQG